MKVHQEPHPTREYSETVHTESITAHPVAESTRESVTTHYVKGASAVLRHAGGSSSTETEDEQGRKVRRKRRKIKTQPRTTEEMRERITRRESGHVVTGHRDSETGVALLERTSTEQLPSYISFGTVEPESLQSPSAEIVSREIRRTGTTRCRFILQEISIEFSK